MFFMIEMIQRLKEEVGFLECPEVHIRSPKGEGSPLPQEAGKGKRRLDGLLLPSLQNELLQAINLAQHRGNTTGIIMWLPLLLNLAVPRHKAEKQSGKGSKNESKPGDEHCW